MARKLQLKPEVLNYVKRARLEAMAEVISRMPLPRQVKLACSIMDKSTPLTKTASYGMAKKAVLLKLLSLRTQTEKKAFWAPLLGLAARGIGAIGTRALPWIANKAIPWMGRMLGTGWNAMSPASRAIGNVGGKLTNTGNNWWNASQGMRQNAAMQRGFSSLADKPMSFQQAMGQGAPGGGFARGMGEMMAMNALATPMMGAMGLGGEQ